MTHIKRAMLRNDILQIDKSILGVYLHNEPSHNSLELCFYTLTPRWILNFALCVVSEEKLFHNFNRKEWMKRNFFSFKEGTKSGYEIVIC